MNKSDQKKYRKLYRDVLRGYSEFKYSDEIIYVKHFSEAELGDIEAYDEQLYEDAKSQGVLTEEEKIKLLIRDKLWSEKKEKFIKERTAEITNLRQGVSKLIIQRQINFALKQVEKKQEELDRLKGERVELVGFTVEAYVEKKISTDYLRHSLFRDENLKKKYFTEEEFYDVSDSKLAEIAITNNLVMSELNMDNLRALAACTFFINSLAISKKNPHIFFGIPVKSMSNYQIDIFSNGLRYLSVLEDGRNPTEAALKSPELLSKWYESMIEAKNKKSKRGDSNLKENTGSTLFGATKEELENYVGAQVDDGETIVDLNKEFDKRGGRNLDFADMIEIHGHGKKGENIRI